jgi:DNA polymerase III delta prime subunit
MDYNFSTLNDKDFEKIVKDLLNAKFKLNLQDFKVGKDKGIDLRFSTNLKNNSIVVQVKHYINSDYAQLKHKLLKEELKKIQKLSPDRYIVVTSLRLSASQKDQLKEGLSPFVQSSNDIIGQEDLNGYLSEFKEIEKKYFKLWFSSVNVFNTIINNAVEGRSKYMINNIRTKISLYVVTQKLDDAKRILNKSSLLLITGQPGIGKTTLAEILLFEWAKNGCKVYKVENIREAEDIISVEDQEKQLFYFDDFLGANYLEIVNAQKTENQLTSFVERVKNTPNKYLILTTRTIILNQAIEMYEKISHSKLANQQFEIKLTDYTDYEKALILYNHLYFRGIREDWYENILEKKFYKKIIRHQNYSPRIIEFITDETKLESIFPKKYSQFILKNLDNPRDIWFYSFNKQIQYFDRCLLLTLFTFEGVSSEFNLFSAFERRLEFERIHNNQIINTEQFNESIRILLNGFIVSNIYTDKSDDRFYKLINPSLTDFLINYVSNSFPDRKNIISSILYVEQLNRFNPEKSIIPLEKELQIIIRDNITKSKIQIIREKNKYFTEINKHAIILETLCRYCRDIDIDTLSLEHFKQIEFTDWAEIAHNIEYFLLNIENAEQTLNYIEENFIAIIEKIMYFTNSTDTVRQIPSLFEKYKHSYIDYVNSDEGGDKLYEVIESLVESYESDYISNNMYDVTDIDEVVDMYHAIENFEKELTEHLSQGFSISYTSSSDRMDKSYWEMIIRDNIERMEEEAQNEEEEEEEAHYRDDSIIDEDASIDDLFLKHE